jgi:uncharacterized protein (DUF58 family)
MIKNRILYASLLFMAFIFVYFYGGKVPYMLFYTVLALPVVSLLNIAAGYLGLKYEQSLDSSSAIKGGKVTYTLRIANRGLFILPYVKIRFFCSSSGLIEKPSIRNISLLPFSKREFCFDLVYKYRGCFELGVSVIEIQDFLGIFKLVRKNKRPLLVTVFPRIVDIEDFSLNARYLPEHTANLDSMYEDVSVIEDINKYNYGDSLKKVHWKLTAKVNELMVKKYQNTAAVSSMFIVDLKRNAFAAESNEVIEDKHIETAVAVLRRCIHKGAAVRLVYHDGEIRTLECSSSLDFENAYQALAEVKFNQEASFKDIIEIQINNIISKPDILLSTSNVDYGLYETLCRVKSAGFDISLIYISPGEITGEKTSGDKQILSALSGAGIKVYSINNSDDIKGVFKYGGSQNR